MMFSRSRFFVALFCLFFSCTALRAQFGGSEQNFSPPSPFYDAPTPAALKGMKARLEGMETRAAAGRITDPQNLALWRFKLEQARLWFDQVAEGNSYYSWDGPEKLKSTLDRATQIETTRGDAAMWAGSFHERAYLSPADGSAQPYWIYLPKGYTPKKKYPLAVFLHGYDPQLTKAAPWLPGIDVTSIATDRGFILAIPYGRRNTDFLSVGEDDTLAVADETQKYYSIDPERVFLTGVSMGGYGVYAVGLHHPDRWAGLAPMAARSDTWLWLKLQRDQIAPWKLPLYEADDPRTLAANALNLPIFIQHGSQDKVVPVQHARLFYNDLKTLGYAVRYREIPDGDHYIYFRAESYQMAYDWMKNLHRQPPPRRVVYTTASLRNSRVYWVEIGAFEDYAKKAHIEAEVQQGRIVVKTENIARFTLRPPKSLLGAATVTLVVNGQEIPGIDTAQPIVWAAQNTDKATTAEFPGIKNPQRAGPIRDCYRDPFLLVYGTLDTTDTDKKAAKIFADEWQRYVDGVPPMKADSAVTDTDRHNYNLILFGTRESNAIIQGIADKLPVELAPDGFRMGARQFSAHGQRLGLVLSYPSPFDARRMVVVQSGERWGAALPINHKFDLQPDYMIFGPKSDFIDGTNLTVSAGFFDNNWQLPTETPISSPNDAEIGDVPQMNTDGNG